MTRLRKALWLAGLVGVVWVFGSVWTHAQVSIPAAQQAFTQLLTTGLAGSSTTAPETISAGSTSGVETSLPLSILSTSVVTADAAPPGRPPATPVRPGRPGNRP